MVKKGKTNRFEKKVKVESQKSTAFGAADSSLL